MSTGTRPPNSHAPRLTLTCLRVMILTVDCSTEHGEGALQHSAV